MAGIALSDGYLAMEHVRTGIAWFKQNRFAEAVRSFDAALRLAPDNPYAHWNRATALLSLGDYTHGFAEHEWAWKLFNWRGFGPVREDIDRLQVLPMWRGESHVRLLLYHELGYGDAIMAMRYLPDLRWNCEVTLVADRPLHRLAQRFGVTVVDRVPKSLLGYDYRLPLFSAMLALQQTVATIPNEPYIAADWRRGGGRIGIAWSGRTQTDFSLADFRAQLTSGDAQLYALQPGAVDDGVIPLSEGCDFTDVADRIAQMDHVVTVDTAAAHLAGAMGHPSAHLLLPYLMDWRWWHAAAWYPTLQTYRQPSADDWATPFAALNAALKEATG